MRYRRLVPGGPEVSELGLGASPLGGIYGTFAERDGIAAVHAALDAGINILDVAPHYGLTAAETVLGKALRGVDHDGYVLATKVGRSGDDVFDFTAEGVTRSVRDSIQRLSVDHIDLTSATTSSSAPWIRWHTRPFQRAGSAAGRSGALGRRDRLPAAWPTRRLRAWACGHRDVVLPVHRAG